MCGRYIYTASAREIALAFDVDEAPALRPRFNVAPTSMVPCVRVEGGKRRLVELRWGLIPSWAKDATIGTRLINARVETLHEKSAFKACLAKRRCLVVTNGFYEWVGPPRARRPVLLRFEDGRTFAYGGLWARWQPGDGGEAVESCTVVTMPPNALAARVHDRMPLILDPKTDGARIAEWLDVSRRPDLAALQVPRELPGFHFYPVDQRVGSVRNDDEACVAPIGPQDRLPLGAG